MEKKNFGRSFFTAALIFLFLQGFIQPAYAVNIFNRLLYQKVALNNIRRYVLVNRLTGEVEYILSLQGKWVPVQRALRYQYQSMIRAQYPTQ